MLDEVSEVIVNKRQDRDARQSLKHLLEMEFFTDFEIISKDNEVCCHKVALAAGSHYFSQKFYDDPHITEIDESKFSINALREVVSFIYNGSCLLNQDNIIDTLNISFKWEIMYLQDECFRFMRDNINNNNACKFYDMAYASDDEETMKQCSFYIRKNFQDLYKLDKFKEISLMGMIDLTKEDMIQLKNENLVLLSYASLDNHGINEEILKKLCKESDCIRLEYLTDKLSRFYKQDGPAVIDERQGNLIKAMYEYKQEFQATLNGNKRPSRFWQQPLCVDKNRNLYRYYKSHNLWKKTAPMPDWYDNNTTILPYQDRLICFYVKKKEPKMKSMLLTRPYKSTSHRPIPKDWLSNPKYVADSEFIYAFGSNRRSHPGATMGYVYRYSSLDRDWYQMCSMIYGVIDPVLIKNRDQVYVIGGIVRAKTTHYFQEFDLKLIDFVERPACPISVSDKIAAGIMYNGNVTIVTDQQLLTYYSKTQFWNVVKFKSIGTVKNVFVFDKDLVVLTINNYNFEFQKFCPKKNKWSNVTVKMPDMDHHSMIYDFQQ